MLGKGVEGMIKKALKPVLKRAMRTVRRYARTWDEEERKKAREESERPRRYEDDDDVYPWLTDQLVKALDASASTFRAHYTWGVLHAAHLARALGVERISVIEFGVAGGNGLISLERISAYVTSLLGVGIDVYGFDTGTGLPPPVDYRDLPNLWRETAFPMDAQRLRQRLQRARLILGAVGETVPEFIATRPAPAGFIAFDLDYYSSTVEAFKLLEADYALLLPRVHCYFDDIMALTFSDYTGERLAIAEFNAAHRTRKLSPIYGLRFHLPRPHAHAQWPEQLYLAHLFDHPLCNRPDGLIRRFVGTRLDLRPDRPAPG
jgi:hypothetical protein